MDLGLKSWKLAMTTGLGQKPRIRTVPAGDVKRLDLELSRAKKRFGLNECASVKSCYEAGRDGFWIHRWLLSVGVDNVVVDPSSIEVDRRRRRRKSDRLDATQLVTRLVRFGLGEPTWSVVAVPSVEAEDARHLHRSLDTLTKERTRMINRIKGLLVSQGLRLDPRLVTFLEDLAGARLWDGSPLPSGLQARVRVEWDRLQVVGAQIRAIEQERDQLLEEGEGVASDQVRQLCKLKGVGIKSAWLLSRELFSWRPYQNRRTAGSLIGLAPTSYGSGSISRELGISKAGNRRVRAVAIQLAWSWIRSEPHSPITRWFQERYAKGSGRSRRIGIVAVARRLIIALWRYVDQGVVPEGAILKA
jgi:transposase